MPLPTPGYFLGVPTNLYGPVPTPGVPSTLFVDLLNTQTVAGAKTFTNTTSFIRAAQAVAAEAIADFGVSDVPIASGRLRILNGAVADGFILPTIQFVSNSASISAGTMLFDAGAGFDSGSFAIADYRYRANGAAVATRPLKTERNGSTIVQQLNTFGNITATIIAQAGVAETLAQWNLSDSASAGVYMYNLSTVDATMAPSVRLVSSGNLGCVYASVGSLDTGSAYGTTFLAAGPGGTAFTTRNPYQFLNGPTQIADFTNGGSFRLTVAGQGLAIKEGSNAKQGVATLVAGTVTVANTSITANSRIQLTGQDNNATGALRVSASVVGTSFTITSSDVGATGVVAYFITEPS